MRTDAQRLTDSFELAFDRAREMSDTERILGWGVLEHRDKSGLLIAALPVSNLITDRGDEYYAKRSMAGVSPATPADQTLVSKMQLGTGTTAVAKTGAGAAMVTFIASSGVVFDATYPQAIDETSGWSIRYKTTWPAGTATNAAITEATLTQQTAANTASVAADTIARLVFTAVPKASTDSLSLTWNHTFLGA